MASNFFRRLLGLISSGRIYRKAKNASAWHFSNKCQYWPLTNFEETTEHPQFGVCPIWVRINSESMHYDS